MIKRLLSSNPFSIDVGLFVMRITLGFGMLTHGIPKLLNFSERAETFSDPLGIGSAPSLVAVVFAEVFCSILLTIGLYTRIALIPLIVTFIIVVFIVHGDDPFGQKEKALLYLLPYLALMFMGPGRYSVDKLRNN